MNSIFSTTSPTPYISVDMYEMDFEAIFLRLAPRIFPSWDCASWKPLIHSYPTGARPDLVMVSKDLSEWFVVEIEDTRHSVQRHIFPQLETLSRGNYGSYLAESLMQRFPEEEPGELQNILKIQPGVICVVNGFVDRIDEACRRLGVTHITCEPYINSLGDVAALTGPIPDELTRPHEPNVFYFKERRSKKAMEKIQEWS